MSNIGEKRRIIIIPRPEEAPIDPQPQQAPVEPVKVPEETPV